MKLTALQQQHVDEIFPKGLKRAQNKWARTWAEAAPEERLAGGVWYRKAFVDLLKGGEGWSFTGDQIAAAAAHLSPRLAWDRNVEATHIAISGGERPNWVFNKAWDNAIKALNAEDPWSTFSERAVKTYNFGRALAGYDDACVIDTHMIHAAMDRHVTYHELDTTAFKVCVKVLMPQLRALAKELNQPCHAVQATIWLAHKEAKWA